MPKVVKQIDLMSPEHKAMLERVMKRAKKMGLTLKTTKKKL